MKEPARDQRNRVRCANDIQPISCRIVDAFRGRHHRCGLCRPAFFWRIEDVLDED